MVNPILNKWSSQIPDKLSKRLNRQPIMVVTSQCIITWERQMPAALKAHGELQIRLQEVLDLDEITLPHTEQSLGLGQQVSIAHVIYHRAVL
jgi:hypothetical protein